jgi:hypothetical protein
VVGAVAAFAVLHIELIVEDTPPEHDRLTGEVGIDLVLRALDRHPGVRPDLAPLRLAREGAEAIPGAHRLDAAVGEVAQPIFHARMRLGTVRLVVVMQQVVHEP